MPLATAQIRRHHLDFNEHLHSRFEGQRFLQAQNDPSRLIIRIRVYFDD